MSSTPSPPCRLGVIGVGHLATTILAGLINSGWRAKDVILAPRGYSAELAERHGFRLATNNKAVVEGSSVVLVAVRPSDAERALEDLPWRPDQLVLSACAGVPLSAIGPAADPAAVTRIMPLTSSELGASPTLVYPAHPAAEAFLSAIGSTIVLSDESQFEACTVSAAVYGWAQMLVRETAEWTIEAGVPEPVARALVARTFVAAGRIIDEKDEPMDHLLDGLCTPGGITEAGLKHLSGAEVPEAWRGACDVVIQKLTKA